MVTGIDHLVIAVTDLDAAAHELEQRIGLAATGGGRHEGVGTANRIAFLADGAYLELLAVEDRDAALRWPVGAAAVRVLETSGPGLATFALVEDDLDQRVEELQANGSPIGPVQPGSRRRPDGELVEWWTAATPDLGPGGVPFLIRHASVGAEWGAAAVEARRTLVHPLGSPVLLSRLDLATPDPPALAARYAAELGIEVWAVGDLAVCTLGPHVVRLVPSREMEVAAALTLGAALDTPRSATLLGLRIEVRPTEVAVRLEQPAG